LGIFLLVSICSPRIDNNLALGTPDNGVFDFVARARQIFPRLLYPPLCGL
jgi:hypothetical protein